MKISHLQKYYFVYMLLAVLWAVLGRAIFGVGGWLGFLMVILLLPAMVLYVVVTGATIFLRNRRSGYVFSAQMKTMVMLTLASLVVFGATVIDSGDTADSTQSLLTSLFGVNGENGAGSVVMFLSGALAWFSTIASVVLLAVVGILSFNDNKSNKRSDTTRVTVPSVRK